MIFHKTGAFSFSLLRELSCLKNIKCKYQVLLCKKSIPVRFISYQPIQSKNIIKIGHKMTQEIEKKREKYISEKNNQFHLKPLINKKKKIIISCSNKQFNHYDNFDHKIFEDKYLFTKNWDKRGSIGNYFTINSFGSHPSLSFNPEIIGTSTETIDFNQMYLNKYLVELLKLNFRFERPTIIQQKSINMIVKSEKHYSIVAETSGGKTLAYVLPAIETCIQMNIWLKNNNIERKFNEPIVIILVPTRELVFQVFNVVKLLISNDEYFNSQNKTENEIDSYYLNYLKNLKVIVDVKIEDIKAREYTIKNEIDSLTSSIPNIKIESDRSIKKEKPIDILITTPARLEKRLVSNKNFSIKGAFLKKLIFDEADTLLDNSFQKTVFNCINNLSLYLNLPTSAFEKCNYDDSKKDFKVHHEIVDHEKKKEIESIFNVILKEQCTQLLFVSATLPVDLNRLLNDIINSESELKIIKTKSSHRLLYHIPQKFIRTNPTGRKEDLLIQLKQEMKKDPKRKILIFSNRQSTAIFVEKYLNENGIRCKCLIKTKPSLIREKVINSFNHGDLNVLSCTDIASRGWDTLNVSHVINFEMPLFAADYLHRSGRVGRLNSKNHTFSNTLVTSYVTKWFEADIVKEIERSVRLGRELENMNGNIKSLYEKLHEEILISKK